jgi:hypothetical protein
MKRLFLFLIPVFLLTPSWLCAAPFSSPWGFSIDLPPGYQAQGNTAEARISFRNPQGAVFEIGVINERRNVKEYLGGILSRLGGRTETRSRPETEAWPIEVFDYHGRDAALAELVFSLGTGYEGWTLCVDRGDSLLLALAYGPAGAGNLEILHLSSLDSIAPTQAEQRYCGPITEFAWPRGPLRETALFNTGIKALFAEGDAEAAQGLVDREFQVLRQFERGPQWQEGWRRFYRMIYRDSWERVSHAAFLLERQWAAEDLLAATEPALSREPGPEAVRLASRGLSFVQDFRYERDLMGSDFVNLVTGLTEGRGDCDSRALLWALILAQANIEAGIMVSRDYGHAMGIADIESQGARFPFEGKNYLVAETTTKVELGLIAQNMSEINRWLGILFESTSSP